MRQEFSCSLPPSANSVSNMKFCVYCGKKLPDTASFCSSCGKKMASHASEPKEKEYSAPSPDTSSEVIKVVSAEDTTIQGSEAPEITDTNVTTDPLEPTAPADTKRKKRRKRQKRPCRIISTVLFALSALGYFVSTPLVLVLSLILLAMIPVFLGMGFVVMGVLGAIINFLGLDSVVTQDSLIGISSILCIVLGLVPTLVLVLSGIWNVFMAVAAMTMPKKLPLSILSAIMVISSFAYNILLCEAIVFVTTLGNDTGALLGGLAFGAVLGLIGALPAIFTILIPKKEFKRKDDIINV